MSDSELLRNLRDALQNVSNHNQTSVQIEALRRYLDNWEQAASDNKKLTEADRQSRLEEWKTQLTVSSAANLEMFKAVIEAGMTALKSAIVINGGAAATLLALLAEGLKANGTGGWGPMLTPLGWAWISFMYGLGAAGTATGTRYVSQALYAEVQRQGENIKRADRFNQGGHWFRNISVLLGFGSYALFFTGAWLIFNVIMATPK